MADISQSNAATRRPLSRLAVNFTAGLALSRLRSRFSRDFRGGGSLGFRRLVPGLAAIFEAAAA